MRATPISSPIWPVKAGHPAEPVMMLSVGSLRSVPVTVHIPLTEVPGRLTRRQS